MSEPSDELARVQAALAEAQTALASVRAERDLSRQQLETLRRQRNAFLGGLAHDLRNPLAPLSNGIELLRLTDADPAGRLRTRGIMERQIAHLMRIADELSDLARLSGEHASLHEATVDLGALLRGLPEAHRAALEAQEITLEIETGPEPLPAVHGDEPRIAQAFGQLVTDLARHSERGSTVRIEAGATGGMVSVRFANLADLAAGDGDALEDVSAGALGLGVTLAEQLVALHGGALRARRPAGARRARFCATLPADPAEATPPAPALAAPAAADAALSVLLADDNIDFSHSFGTMLELLGHRVEVVHDGLAAVAAIAGAPPDVAFIDIGMPSLDGVEAVRRVRGQGIDAQDVLLVAVTGRGGAEDRARAAEAGFDRYLVKPFAMQDVRDALEAAQAIRAGASRRQPGSFAGSRTTAA